MLRIARCTRPLRVREKRWKVDLRWLLAGLTIAPPADPELAIEAIRMLLRREGLDGPPLQRLISPATRKSIYNLRFDSSPGTLRIHLDAPINPFADRETTTYAAGLRLSGPISIGKERCHCPIGAILCGLLAS